MRFSLYVFTRTFRKISDEERMSKFYQKVEHTQVPIIFILGGFTSETFIYYAAKNKPMAEPSLFPDAPSPPSEQELTRKGPAVSTATSQAVTALGARLRVLEERYTNLRHKTQLTDQNMIELEKGLKGEVKRMLGTLDEMKKELDEISRRALQLVDEVKNTVKQSDFKVVEKYLEFWDPLKFVTREEAERVLTGQAPKAPLPEETQEEEPKSSLYDG